MGRYRKIVSKIWDDDKFPYLTVDAQRLFWLHLTSSRSTPFLLYVEGEGAMSDTLRAEGKVMPLSRVRRAKQELSDRQMAWYAKDGSNLLFLPNALKQKENAPDGGNSLITWFGLFNELPRTPFLEHCTGHLLTILDQVEHPLTREFIRALAGPYPKGKPKGTVTHQEPKTDEPPIQEQEQEQKKKEKYIYGDFRNVRLTEEEHGALVQRFGESGAKLRIENLSSYIASKGKKYSSHYATLLVWERKNGDGNGTRQHAAGPNGGNLGRGALPKRQWEPKQP
jgi:hypothetical protein